MCASSPNVLMIVTKVVIWDGETIDTKDKLYENYENYGKIMMHCTSVKFLYVLELLWRLGYISPWTPANK